MRKYGAAFCIAAIFSVLSCLVGTALAGSGTTTDKNSRVVYQPVMPQSPPVVLMPETTGELWRIIHRSADGRPLKIEVGYPDGRLGTYDFDQAGKLRTFSSHLGGKLLFHAEYDGSGFISRSKTYSVDGKQTQQFQRLQDGTQETLQLDQSGNVSLAVVTTSDGVRKTIRKADGIKPAEITIVPATAAEILLGQHAANGSPKLKIATSGARVDSWEYLDADGKVLHKGKLLLNGNVEITVHDSYGKPSFKQVWQLVGEDWSRGYYRLSQVEDYDYQGRVGSVTELYADGKTPRVTHSFWGERKTYSEFFDSNGYQLRSVYYNSDGTPSSSYDSTSSPYRSKRELGESKSQAPSDAGRPIYRLGGNPYSELPSSKPHEPHPLFIRQ